MGGGGVGLGGQGGCEWRSEAFAKIQKKFFLGVGARVRGGGSGWGGGGQGGWEQRSEACVKFKKKLGGGRVWGGGGGSGWRGVRVNVNGEVELL